MKRLFSVFALLLMAVVGASAQQLVNCEKANDVSKLPLYFVNKVALASDEIVQWQKPMPLINVQPLKHVALSKAAKKSVRMAENWDTLGVATITDDVVGYILGDVESSTYEVTVLKSGSSYQLLKAFGSKHPAYSAMKDLASYKSTAILIDAANADSVVIEKQNIGWTGKLFSEVYELAAVGKMVDGVITFPKEKIRLYEDDETPYSGYGDLTVALPKADEPTWTSVGTCEFTDGVLITAYGGSPLTYNVEVEKNDQNPNIYRLVDPFGAPSPMYNTFAQMGTFTPSYVEVDATDPENVTIALQTMGFVDATYGEAFIAASNGKLNSIGSVEFAYGDAALWQEGYDYAGTLSFQLPDLVPQEWPDEWEPFAPAGENLAKWTYGAWQEGYTDSLLMYVRTSNFDDTQKQIKIANWGFGFFTDEGVEIILNWDTTNNHISVPVQTTGVLNTYYNEDIVFGAIHDILGSQYFANYPSTYDPETGLFTLNLLYSIPSIIYNGQGFGNGVETIKMYGFKDYSFDFACAAINDEDVPEGVTAIQTVAVNTGDDITGYVAKAYAYEEVSGADAIEALAKEQSGITTAETVDLELGGSMYDVYYVIVSVYDGEKFVGYDYEMVQVQPNADWETVGEFPYRDDIVTGLYSIRVDGEILRGPVYNVEVQRNLNNPKLYRLKNPYGYNTILGDYCAYENAYLYLNTSNPAQVNAGYLLNRNDIGVDFGSGAFSIATQSAGTFDGYKITFPTRGLIVYEGNSAYYSNTHGLFLAVVNQKPDTFTLSDSTATVSINETLSITSDNTEGEAPTFVTLNEDIATVDSLGVVTGVAPGVAQIVVSQPEYFEFAETTDTIDITVSLVGDVTDLFLKNAKFLNGAADWNVDFNPGLANDGEIGALEAYAGWGSLELSKFNILQDVVLPSGQYRLTSNAFFRYGVSAGTDASKSEAYMVCGDNDRTLLPSLGSIPGISNYANSMAEAISAFKNGLYETSTEFKVLEDSTTVTVGYSGVFTLKQSWFISGPMKLEYLGAISLDSYIAELESLLNNLPEGAMAADVKEALDAAASQAQDFLDQYNTDPSNLTPKSADEIVNALKAAINAAENSVIEYSPLVAQLAEYQAKVAELCGTDTSDLEDAMTAIEEMLNTGADINTIKAALDALYEPFIEAVKNQTEVGAQFVALTGNTKADWVNATGLFGDGAERYNESMYTGDVMYQTIQGLPAGTYEVMAIYEASYTSGRGFGGATGDSLTYAYANDAQQYVEVVDRTGVELKDTVVLNAVVEEGGELKYGLYNEKAGANWFVAKVLSVKLIELPAPELATWTSIGSSKFTDGVYITGYGIEAQTYKVEMQQQDQNANIYRLVDAFGESHPYYKTLISAGIATYADSTFIEFDLTDPENVTIALQATGLTDSYGEAFIKSVKGGKLVDGKVVFEDGDIVLVQEGEEYPGMVSFTVPGLVPDPNAGWTSLGMCKYTDDFFPSMFSVDPITMDVEIQECDTLPGFYRLVNPYAEYPKNMGTVDVDNDYYMYIHAEDPEKVYIEHYAESGIISSNYGNYRLTSMAGYMIANGKTPDPTSFGTYDPDFKAITFPVKSLLFMLPGYSNSWYYANIEGAFKVALPGAPDYSFATTLGSFTEDVEAATAVQTVNVEATGAEFAGYVAGVFTEDEIANLDSCISVVMQNTVMTADTYDAELTEEGESYVLFAAVTPSGNYAQTNAIVPVTFDPTKNWTSLGMRELTDGFICDMWNVGGAYTWLVEVQESKTKPGLYRIKNPYLDYPVTFNTQAHRTDVYLVIDASKPNAVSMAEQKLGYEIGTYGELSARSLSAGTFDGYDITFPTRGLILTLPTKGSYYANQDGTFCLSIVPKKEITLPESGMMTFSSAFDLAIPEGLEAWYAVDCNEEEVTLVPVEGGVIPANTGVVLKGEADATYTLVAAEAEAPVLEGNLLVSVPDYYEVAPTEDGNYNYVFDADHFVAMTDTLEFEPFDVYLSTSVEASQLGLYFDTTIVGIQSIDMNAAKAEAVDLQGRRVNSMTKGQVYIVDRKKILAK